MAASAEPRPKAPSAGAPALPWPAVRRLGVPPLTLPDLSFSLVLGSRRSRRQLARAPLRDALGWLNLATTPVQLSELSGLERRKAPALSAGALHSVTPLLITGRGRPRIFQPKPLEAAAVELAVATAAPLRALQVRAGDLLPSVSTCDLVVLACDLARITAVYDEPQSLAWRDAGALLQTLALTATAVGLGLCPLGLLGGEAAEALGMRGDLLAVGVAAVGV